MRVGSQRIDDEPRTGAAVALAAVPRSASFRDIVTGEVDPEPAEEKAVPRPFAN